MIIWVALGGRGHLWGAMVGALVVNYGYSVMTSDMPKAWPFFEGGMFVAVVMFFPTGLVGLWKQLEREIASGARVGWIAAGIGVGLVGLALGRFGWIPAALQDTVSWTFPMAMLLLILASRSLTGLVVGAIAFFFLGEALGLVPRPLQAVWMGAPLKYHMLGAVLVAAALLARFQIFRRPVEVKA